MVDLQHVAVTILYKESGIAFVIDNAQQIELLAQGALQLELTVLWAAFRIKRTLTYLLMSGELVIVRHKVLAHVDAHLCLLFPKLSIELKTTQM